MHLLICPTIFLQIFSSVGGWILPGPLEELHWFKKPIVRLPPGSSAAEAARLRFSKRLPQAIIIGVKKGGTRALLEYLRVHPGVRAPGPEIHFFDRFYERGLEWYRKQMPATVAGQITIEKTPGYFIHPDVPRHMADMSKDLKLLLVVRNPVTRALSDYAQQVTKHANMAGFSETVLPSGVNASVDSHWGGIKVGLYARHLARWLQYFPLHQIRVVSGEALINDPVSEIQSVEKFLGLTPYIHSSHFYFNETKGFPCVRKRPYDNTETLVFRCLGKTKGRPHPFLEPKVGQKLLSFYRPYNEQFFKMIDREFDWDWFTSTARHA